MFRFPPRRILVPADLSSPSISALGAAKKLASGSKAFLDVVYIQEMPRDLMIAGVDLGPDPMPEIIREVGEFRRWHEEKLRKMVSDLPASRVRVRTLSGPAVFDIAALARPRSADLVVIGTHGYRGLNRAFFGSVAEAVVRKSEVPVLVIHSGAVPARMSRTLIPCNMTPYADAALKYALEMAEALSIKGTVLYAAPVGSDEQGAQEELRRHVEALVGAASAQRLSFLARIGDPRRIILEEAERGRFDLIALSAHRRPFLRDFVLGSTAERVLRYSTSPVLAVPSTERPAVKRRAIAGVGRR